MFRAKLLGVVLVTGLVFLGLVVSQVANAGEYAPDANTVALWHFSEASTPVFYPTAFYDSSGNKFGFAFGDPWTTEGRYGGGIQGDVGTGDWAWLLIDKTFSQFTLEFWMKPVESGVTQEIVSNIYSFAHDLITPSGAVDFSFWNTGGERASLWNGSTIFSAGQWYHVAVTYDGTTAKRYVDGICDGSVAFTGQVHGSVLMVPGEPNWAPSFSGIIDEVRISDIARTADEIAHGADILSPVAVASVTLPAIEATGVLTNVSAYLSCVGSYDPDGGNITCVFAPVSLAVGITAVTLTVTDDEGDTATATVNVTVVDTTPPTITAGIVPVGGSQSEYEVVATATDLVDPNPVVIATLGVAVEDGQRVNLPPGEGRGHFLIKGATEGVLTVVATDASNKSSLVEVPFLP